MTVDETTPKDLLAGLPADLAPDATGRRREVAMATKQAILRHGLEATTLREIGREAGFTTGVIMHHFADKDAVIEACFQAVSWDFLTGAETCLASAGSARDRLRAIVAFGLPHDAEGRAEWRLWSEMWVYAGGRSQLADTLTEVDRLWEQQLRGALAAAAAEGVIGTTLDLDEEARVVARLIDGAGVRGWFTGNWEAAHATLEHYLDRLEVGA